MKSETPLYKHVYRVFFEDKSSIRIMAFDKADAKIQVQKLKPTKKIKRIEKIAD